MNSLQNTKRPGLRPTPAEHIGAGMTIKVDGEILTVTGVKADRGRVELETTRGGVFVAMGGPVAVVVDEHGRPVRAPEPTAMQALNRPSVHVPTPREWQIIANTALGWILQVPETTLPVVTWRIYDQPGYVRPLVGQVREDDAAPVVQAYAEFLDATPELYHHGDRVRVQGIYLGCPVEVWGITPQLREKERRAAEAKAAAS